MALVATASQTVGPFFAIAFTRSYVTEMAPPGVRGERIAVAGRVLDGAGAPVADACLEIWQADAEGHYGAPGEFRGFGRVATDGEGRFAFTTVRPGRVASHDGHPMAPHLVVSVLARGLLRRLLTRMYFPDDPGNAGDPVLALVPPDRRATLIARAAGAGRLDWTVILQGAGETVFFDL